MELQNDNPLTTFEVEDVPLSSPFPIVHSPSHHFSSSASSTTTCDDDEKKRKDGHGRKKNKFQETRHPTYKELRRRDNKRVCELRRPLHKGSCICLGTFPTPEMAAPARAHDTAAIELGARLNFSEEQPKFLPRANSCSMSSVRHAAATHNQTANNNNNNNNKYSSASAHHYSSSSSSRCEEMKLLEHCCSVEEQVFMDEEALFNFPGLLDSMAEGLMVSPPAMQRGFYRDSVDDFVELCLWTHD